MSKSVSRWSVKRPDPYTEIGIKRLKCIRCGKKAKYQWSICADNNQHRPICGECDILLNDTVLKFMGHPNVKEKIEAYKIYCRGE